jgi:ribosomal protein L16 Arg81 hydroxylase
MMLRIKEAFNREFEKVLKLRQNQNEIINDKNKRIEEITEELKKGNETLRGRKNILESNESVLEVAPTDIPFARYLSKEEREKAERERLRE